MHSPGGSAGGFVLVAVLAAVVVITLLAAAVATVSARAVAEARAEVTTFEADVAMASTRDTLLYLLNTKRQTYGGITVDDQVLWSAGQATATRPEEEGFDLPSQLPIGNEIRLDGTPYLGLDGARFALQDDAGLFSPNWTFPMYRPGFFTMLGVPPGDWAGLEAKRLDYQDPDNLYRLEGGEADAYARAELPPPSNRPLATPLEVRGILGWAKALESMDDNALASTITSARTVLVNVNTAPKAVLRSLPGVDEATAERIVALRENLPFMLTWQFADAFNLPISQDEPVGLLAVGYGTLKLWHNAGGPVQMLHWTLTPIDEGGRPWRIDYEITLPRDEGTDDALARTPETPLLAPPAAAGR